MRNHASGGVEGRPYGSGAPPNERLDFMPNPLAIRRADQCARIVVFVVGLIGGLGAQRAAAADDSPALVESSRARLTLADYESEMAKVPAPARLQFASSRARLAQLLNGLYLNRAIANDARATGLDRDPNIARQIELTVDKLLAEARREKLDRDSAAAFDANQEKFLPRAREIYLMNAEKYGTPEKIRASHLLVKVGDTGDDAAKARAEELRARVVAGAALADVAREYSDDASGKRNGGDLGFFAAKDVDPAFAEAAFALRTPGELSPVTKSAFGYHVIQFRERRPAVQRPFAAVEKEILAELRKTFIESERSAYETALLTNPAPKANEALIEKIHATARATAPPPPTAPPTGRPPKASR